jgi:ankyrin repeat protein
MGCGASSAKAPYAVDSKHPEPKPEDLPGSERKPTPAKPKVKKEQTSVYDAHLISHCEPMVKELFHAVSNDDAEQVQKLVDRRVPLDGMDANGNSVLILAAAGERECTRTLLSAKAPLEVKNKEGKRALTIAIQYEDAHIVRMLVEAGAVVDDEAKRLVRATNLPDLISALTGESAAEELTKKANADSFNRHKRSFNKRVNSMSADDVESYTEGWGTANQMPTADAFRERQSVMKDARVSRRANREGVVEGMLPNAASLFGAVFDADTELVSKLIKQGAPVDAQDTEGNTPLILAAEGEAECVQALIDGKSPLEHRNKEGTTALMTAIMYEDSEITVMLLNAGAQATEEAISLGRDSGVPEIITALTGEIVPDRSIDRQSFRAKVVSDVRVGSTSEENIEGFTRTFTTENATLVNPDTASSHGSLSSLSFKKGSVLANISESDMEQGAAEET